MVVTSVISRTSLKQGWKCVRKTQIGVEIDLFGFAWRSKGAARNNFEPAGLDREAWKSGWKSPKIPKSPQKGRHEARQDFEVPDIFDIQKTQEHSSLPNLLTFHWLDIKV